MSNYISGIFNYCDRWCERCAFTKRCRLFADEKRIEAKIREWDAFEEAMKRAGCDIHEPEPEPTPVVDVSPPKKRRRPKRNELVRAADEYMEAVFAWLKAQPDDHRSRDVLPEPGSVEDLMDIIGWYHMQIMVKLTRASSGLRSAEKVKPWETDELADIDRSDADGSAKVALIGIERSLGAWTLLRMQHHREEDFAKCCIGQLARLRRAVEERFPNARTFHRPGLDD